MLAQVIVLCVCVDHAEVQAWRAPCAALIGGRVSPLHTGGSPASTREALFGNSEAFAAGSLHPALHSHELPLRR